MLVGHRGWAIQRYRQWVLVMLTPQLRGRNVAATQIPSAPSHAAAISRFAMTIHFPFAS